MPCPTNWQKLLKYAENGRQNVGFFFTEAVEKHVWLLKKFATGGGSGTSIIRFDDTSILEKNIILCVWNDGCATQDFCDRSWWWGKVVFHLLDKIRIFDELLSCVRRRSAAAHFSFFSKLIKSATKYGGRDGLRCIISMPCFFYQHPLSYVPMNI